MSQFSNPLQILNPTLNDHNEQPENTIGMVIPPRYDPYAQTPSEFGQQMGRFFHAPANPPFFQIPEIDQSLEGLFESLSAQNMSVAGADLCSKGHKHPRWPIKGDLDIKKCERRCDYCKKKLSSAAGLRKVSTCPYFATTSTRMNLRLTRTQHVFLHKTQDSLDINILTSRSGPNRPTLDLSENRNQIIDPGHDNSNTLDSSGQSLESSTLNIQRSTPPQSTASDVSHAKKPTTSTPPRCSPTPEQEIEIVLPGSDASPVDDSIEDIQPSLETSLEDRIMSRLESKIEARLVAEFEGNFEAKVKAAVDQQLEAKINERLQEILFFTTKKSTDAQREQDLDSEKITRNQITDIQKQQSAIMSRFHQMDSKIEEFFVSRKTIREIADIQKQVCVFQELFFRAQKEFSQSSADQRTLRNEIKDIRAQQREVADAISRLWMDKNQLYQQSVAFQTLHDRHENAINAILSRYLSRNGSQQKPG
jgi:hypothetical protein